MVDVVFPTPPFWFAKAIILTIVFVCLDDYKYDDSAFFGNLLIWWKDQKLASNASTFDAEEKTAILWLLR